MALDLKIEQAWKNLGWQLGTGDWNGVKEIIAQNHCLEVFQDCAALDWRNILPSNHGFLFDFAEIGESRQPQARIWISYIQRRFAIATDYPKIQWHPPVLWLGIGCRQSVSANLLAEAIATTCRSSHLATSAIAGIATIESRRDHAAILELVNVHNWRLQTYSASQLDQVITAQRSLSLKQTIDTASVAEAAAMLAANQDRLLVTKTIYSGSITLAIALVSESTI